MVLDLWLPIVVSTVALFFASFLSWMVLPIHFKDWRKLSSEDPLIDLVRSNNIPPGNYMYPGWDTPDEMKSEEYQKKYEDGPCGLLCVFPKIGMGRNLGLTVVFFLVVNVALAAVAEMAGLEAGAEASKIFPLLMTVGVMTFVGALVQHAIWFHNRIVGHIIESIAYAAIAAGVFCGLWPAAT